MRAAPAATLELEWSYIYKPLAVHFFDFTVVEAGINVILINANQIHSGNETHMHTRTKCH